LGQSISDFPASVGLQGIIADLYQLLAVAADLAAEFLDHHLGAEADAEKGLALRQRHADPVDLPVHEGVRVVGAHRPAENHGARVPVHGVREGVAEAGLADVEGKAAFDQLLAHPSGR
jgi:hypothetical protein